jgi:hypothetical protein
LLFRILQWSVVTWRASMGPRPAVVAEAPQDDSRSAFASLEYRGTALAGAPDRSRDKQAEREQQLLSSINARSAGIPCNTLWQTLLLEVGLQPEQ